jgi:gliding motility-associated lipoprotein GldD
MKLLHFFSILLLILFISSCKESFTPKPKSYPRIDYPDRSYQKYSGDCPYTFDYPVYAILEAEGDPDSSPCWFNIVYKPFNARLHLSYKSIRSQSDLSVYAEDAHNLVYKHTVKAEEINESLIKTNNKVYGMLYELEGNTATALEFFVTDSSTHYLRGALYFKTRINRDSLDPMIDFLKVDVKKMIETMKWKE